MLEGIALFLRFWRDAEGFPPRYAAKPLRVHRLPVDSRIGNMA
ncbi:hypothetical protein [Paraburkholderia mimosarum]|nr:hypothetical protein [Paraburkholderia mimosarum]